VCIPPLAHECTPFLFPGSSGLCPNLSTAARNPYAKTADAMAFDVVQEEEGEGESSGRHNYRY